MDSAGFSICAAQALVVPALVPDQRWSWRNQQGLAGVEAGLWTVGGGSAAAAEWYSTAVFYRFLTALIKCVRHSTSYFLLTFPLIWTPTLPLHLLVQAIHHRLIFSLHCTNCCCYSVGFGVTASTDLKILLPSIRRITVEDDSTTHHWTGPLRLLLFSFFLLTVSRVGDGGGSWSRR